MRTGRNLALNLTRSLMGIGIAAVSCALLSCGKECEADNRVSDHIGEMNFLLCAESRDELYRWLNERTRDRPGYAREILYFESTNATGDVEVIRSAERYQDQDYWYSTKDAKMDLWYFGPDFELPEVVICDEVVIFVSRDSWEFRLLWGDIPILDLSRNFTRQDVCDQRGSDHYMMNPEWQAIIFSEFEDISDVPTGRARRVVDNEIITPEL